jgi:ABC-2 type transport system ATP-binding protein
MLQRLGVAQALIGDPPFLLLDEPALGLDPAAQKFMRDQILVLHREGKTVLLSSHHLDEVTRVCTHVAVLNRGRLVRCGPLDVILAPRTQVAITTDSLVPELAARLRALGPGITAGGTAVTLNGEGLAQKSAVLRLLLDAGVDIRRLTEQQSTLEEVYLEATGA